MKDFCNKSQAPKGKKSKGNLGGGEKSTTKKGCYGKLGCFFIRKECTFWESLAIYPSIIPDIPVQYSIYHCRRNFVSQYVETNALAAINITSPIVNILTGIALVFAAGGSAMAAISIGANKEEQAGQEFTLCIYVFFQRYILAGVATGAVKE